MTRGAAGPVSILQLSAGTVPRMEVRVLLARALGPKIARALSPRTAAFLRRSSRVLTTKLLLEVRRVLDGDGQAHVLHAAELERAARAACERVLPALGLEAELKEILQALPPESSKVEVRP